MSPVRPHLHDQSALVAWALVCIWAQIGDGAVRLRATEARPTEPPVPLDVVALARGEDQVIMAAGASVSAEHNAKATVAHKAELSAALAKEAAEDAYKEGLPAYAEVHEALGTAKAWALEASRHAAHAKQMAWEARHIAEKAAEKAVQAVEAQVEEDARVSAVKAAAVPTSNSGPMRAKTITANVAAAAEPFHIALLREQKRAAEDYQKAHKAVEAAIKLGQDAQIMAKNAQEMQENGMGLQASFTMTRAHSTMQAAANMKAYAYHLYDEAVLLNSRLGQYGLDMGQAAANAAGATPQDPVPVLPDEARVAPATPPFPAG